ncbi:MAG: hypothetical protein K5821_15955 [Nitrobacter sp.]|uniref:hypothetical protein n=1 Tax=Nitrobacter sp. TaxID=29420 RepID=UPI0026090898|nr:hypothetical protein [Nitrobacter sp.]MCV0387863.1 hypothetical protein [Nitrobacter sp.]
MKMEFPSQKSLWILVVMLVAWTAFALCMILLPKASPGRDEGMFMASVMASVQFPVTALIMIMLALPRAR